MGAVAHQAVVRLRLHGGWPAHRVRPEPLWDGLPVEWDVETRPAGPDLALTVRLQVEADDEEQAALTARTACVDELQRLALPDVTGWTVRAVEVRRRGVA